jgi:hypothetical protein
LIHLNRPWADVGYGGGISHCSVKSVFRKFGSGWPLSVSLCSCFLQTPVSGAVGTLPNKLVVEGATPVQNFFKQTVKLLVDLWEDYFYLVDVRQENRRLKLELDSLKRENSLYREMVATQERLSELLKFKEAVSQPAVAAQVVGLDPTGWFQSVVINKGDQSGIKLDMPVVNASGVVGRIVSVSPHYAKVLLIIDQNSAVDCLVQRSRDRGMVRGQSAQVCRLDYMVKSGRCEGRGCGDHIGFGTGISQGASHWNGFQRERRVWNAFQRDRSDACRGFFQIGGGPGDSASAQRRAQKASDPSMN